MSIFDFLRDIINREGGMLFLLLCVVVISIAIVLSIDALVKLRLITVNKTYHVTGCDECPHCAEARAKRRKS